MDYKAHLWGDRENTEKQFIALKQAVESYKKGCDLKHLKSCEELKTIYHPEYGKEYAEVVDQNLTKVDEYWNLSVEYDEKNQAHIKGCAENNAIACSDLARAYNYGCEWGSVSGQKSKAFEFYTKACDLGSSDGCVSLATFYARDKNIEKFREFTIRSLDNELKERYFDDIQKCQANDGETCDKLVVILGNLGIVVLIVILSHLSMVMIYGEMNVKKFTISSVMNYIKNLVI